MNNPLLKENCNVHIDKLNQEFVMVSDDAGINSDGKKGRNAWKASNQTWQIKRRIAQADNRALIIHIFGNPSFSDTR